MGEDGMHTATPCEAYEEARSQRPIYSPLPTWGMLGEDMRRAIGFVAFSSRHNAHNDLVAALKQIECVADDNANAQHIEMAIDFIRQIASAALSKAQG